MIKRHHGRIVAISVIVGLLLGGFQNCSYPGSVAKPAKAQYSPQGNGDGYSGKVELYRHQNSTAPCAALDREGQPLPNEQIFYQSPTVGGAKSPYLVRENCADITPRLIASSDLKFTVKGLAYKGNGFLSYERDNGFQVLAAKCPAGKSPIANVVRTNLIVNSQDWTEQPEYRGWMWHSGIVALLNGSIESLPAYTVVRNDSAFPEEYRRISQMKQLKSSTDYAFSFLAKKGTRDGVTFRYYRQDQKTNNEEYLIIDFDLNNGTSNIRLNSYLAPATISMSKVGEGYFCTVYFKTSATGGENFSDFGFSPTAVNGATHVGDSVYATAAQLEETAGFCQ